MRPTLSILLISFLLNASGAAAEPSAHVNVDQLVAQLDHEEFAQREAASAGLLKLGADAEAPLRECVRSTRSAEQKLRAEALLKALEKEIALKGIIGGKPSAGLQLALAPAAQEMNSSQGVRIVARLKNVSKETVRCVPLQELALNSPARQESSNTAQGVLNIRKVSGSESGNKTISASFDLRRGQPDAIALAAGESSLLNIRLDDDNALEPGEYEAEARYNASSDALQDGAKEDLASNTIKFVVK